MTLLDFILQELKNTHTYLETRILRIPKNDRKPIFERMRRIREAIRILELSQDSTASLDCWLDIPREKARINEK